MAAGDPSNFDTLSGILNKLTDSFGEDTLTSNETNELLDSYDSVSKGVKGSKAMKKFIKSLKKAALTNDATDLAER